MPDPAKNPNTLDSRVSVLENSLSEIRDDVHSIASKMDAQATAIASKMDSFSAATAPNFSTMAAWAGIVLVIIGLVGTPIGWFVTRELDRHEQLTKSLDDKLQREFTLAISRVDSETANINRQSEERHHDAERQVDLVRDAVKHSEDQIDWGIRADLDELRQRRMKADTSK